MLQEMIDLIDRLKYYGHKPTPAELIELLERWARRAKK